MLAVSGLRSGLICVWVLARLGGCDGSGPGFGAFGRSGARCRVRWRPSASGSFGDFWAGPGVAPRGGGLLGNVVRWRRPLPGGQARRVVWCAGLLGCCYGFEQQQRSSAQVASRSRNRTAVCE